MSTAPQLREAGERRPCGANRCLSVYHIYLQISAGIKNATAARCRGVAANPRVTNAGFFLLVPVCVSRTFVVSSFHNTDLLFTFIISLSKVTHKVCVRVFVYVCDHARAHHLLNSITVSEWNRELRPCSMRLIKLDCI